jgi:hypothetical protein
LSARALETFGVNPDRALLRCDRVATAPTSPKRPSCREQKGQPNKKRWGIFGEEKQDADDGFRSVTEAGNESVVETCGNRG